MKQSLSLVAVSLTAVLGVAFWPGDTTAQDRGDKQEKTPLQLAMRTVMGVTKDLRTSLGDPEQRDAALEQLTSLQSALVTAKSETPSKAADLEGDDLTQFMDGYRHQLISLLTATLEIEGMVLDGADKDELQRKLKELGAIKQAGHDAYK